MNACRKHPGWAALAALLLGFAVSGLSIPAPAQSPSAAPASPMPQISVNSSLVKIDAVVRDKKGAIAKTLTKDDFIVNEDDHPQAITYFAPGTDEPLTLGLIVDTSRSQSSTISNTRDASRTFFDHSVREDKDQGFLIHFDQQVELLQDLTASRQKLDGALDLLSSPQLQRRNDDDGGNGGGTGGGGNGGGNGGGGNGGGPYGGGGYGRRGGGQGGQFAANNQLYDAIYLASNELTKNQPGRKTLVVVSNGMDRGSKESLDDAIQAAQRSDTIVYTVLMQGENEGGGGFGGRPGFGGGGYGRGGGRGRYPQQERADPKKVLGRIASETGAQMFEVSKKQTIEDVYTAIAEDLHGQYSIGYAPAPTTSASFHTIKVTMKSKDLTVQARTGYYSDALKTPSQDSSPPPTANPPTP